MSNTLINRPTYTDKLIQYLNLPIVKVITGMRRVGKSSILKLVIQKLNKKTPKSRVLYINKELPEFREITDDTTLIKYIKKNSQAPKDQFYIFIDEVQEITQWQKAIRALLAEGYNLTITGSSASLFTTELSTLLSGRYISFPVYPLSYKEFLRFKELENSKQALLEYLEFGGLPSVVTLTSDPDIKFAYLKDIINSVLFKDVILRYSIRNTIPFERITEFLLDNMTKQTSARSISKYFKSINITMNQETVLKYINYLKNAFVIHIVPYSDIKGKKILKYPSKIFVNDTGLRSALLGFDPLSVEKYIENIVFLHLKIKGYEIRIGKFNNYEIDFIANKNNETIFIQVSYLLSSTSTIEREIRNLLKIPNNYPKYVVHFSPTIPQANYHGIEFLKLDEFLLNL